MDLMEIRRRLLRNTPLLPIAYQRVKWLSRTSDNRGPYSKVDINVNVGSKIITQTRKYVTNDERAFAGAYGITDYPNLELYYKGDKGDEIRAFLAGGGLDHFSVQYGTNDDPDVMSVVNNSPNIIKIYYLGCYRTTAYHFNGRIYGLTIKDSDDIVTHDFVPCYRKRDMEPGFYERITDVFCPNIADSGTWGIGDIVRE